MMETQGNLERLILPQPAHIGYVTRDLERAVKNLRKYWGIESVTQMSHDYFNRRFYQEPGDFKLRIAYARVGAIVYEIITILEGKTVYEEFLDKCGDGIHHLGYDIPDLAQWTEAYKRMGVEPIMSGERKGLKWAYFNTPEIVVELCERAPAS
jgi:hypothetical protein